SPGSWSRPPWRLPGPPGGPHRPTSSVPLGQQMTEDFAKVNSLKRVPALKDGDFALAEGVAILHYLSQKYKTPAHWYPPELQARARVDEYLSWHSDSVRGTFGTMLWIRVLGPLIDVQIPKEKVDKNMAAVVQSLQHLEQKFLQDKPFLTGDKISFADLMALEELVQVWGRDSAPALEGGKVGSQGGCPGPELSRSPLILSILSLALSGVAAPWSQAGPERASPWTDGG
ncbi:glutathione S-transferase theta-2-like, partial [Gracilinanus agilis]|uniref:glutathione S-transferase theta-2-like n=1 Tax=Gracilinanus agilis TaxID=191870 RepID=UPI001CFC585B